MIAKLGTCLLTLPLDDLLVALSVFHALAVNGVPEEHQALFVPVVPILMVLVRRCVRHFIKKQSVAQSSYHVVLYQALSILAFMYSVSIITYSIFNASEKNVAARARSDL